MFSDAVMIMGNYVKLSHETITSEIIRYIEADAERHNVVLEHLSLEYCSFDCEQTVREFSVFMDRFALVDMFRTQSHFGLFDHAVSLTSLQLFMMGLEPHMLASIWQLGSLEKLVIDGCHFLMSYGDAASFFSSLPAGLKTLCINTSSFQFVPWLEELRVPSLDKLTIHADDMTQHEYTTLCDVLAGHSGALTMLDIRGGKRIVDMRGMIAVFEANPKLASFYAPEYTNWMEAAMILPRLLRNRPNFRLTCPTILDDAARDKVYRCAYGYDATIALYNYTPTTFPALLNRDFLGLRNRDFLGWLLLFSAKILPPEVCRELLKFLF